MRLPSELYCECCECDDDAWSEKNNKNRVYCLESNIFILRMIMESV